MQIRPVEVLSSEGGGGRVSENSHHVFHHTHLSLTITHTGNNNWRKRTEPQMRAKPKRHTPSIRETRTGDVWTRTRTCSAGSKQRVRGMYSTTIFLATIVRSTLICRRWSWRDKGKGCEGGGGEGEFT